ncbi:hypothetical protein HOLleu_07364 [Holothuria leucospilota]|uniref:RNA-directed DNA polymerase n=1 Tax=Holothuria leucospilota TaxID=206669 RepID=A0A9Q1HGX7_HOLLE|nr:hypothetical protein HOLleu_07364 [Holothuria leucospilota]
MELLEKRFARKVNFVSERYTFRQRAQGQGESINSFISNLRELAKSCDFGQKHDEMIRDQLIEKTNSRKIRERLLVEENLTLDKAITLAQRVEAALKDSSTFAGTTGMNNYSNPVNATFLQKSNRQGKSANFTTERSARVQDNSSNFSEGRRCYRCNSSRHLANDPTCPANGEQCRNCKKIGHFARVCRSTKGNQQGVKVHYSGKKHNQVREVNLFPKESFSDTLHRTEAEKEAEIQVLTLEENFAPAVQSTNLASRPMSCDVLINQVPISMQVDTGSGVTILGKDLFDKHFLREALVPPPRDRTFSSYTQHEIDIIGCFRALVKYQGKAAIGNIYVTDKGSNLLGRDIIQALPINIAGSTLSCNTVEGTCATPTQSPGIGKMSWGQGPIKGFLHKVKVKENVYPVQQKLRRLPFAVREKVSEELKRLEEQGIIEKVDTSEWISPTVVKWKENGDMRICVDLREVNKAIIPDKFPLPNIDEMMTEFQNAKVFSRLDLKQAYHQLELHPDSRSLTGFITHDGVFQYKRLCVGLASAPSVFKKVMSIILAGLPKVQVYLDDIIVWGVTQEEHDVNLEKVFDRLTKYNVKLNKSKCELSKKELKFLGHRLTDHGIKINDKYQAITNAAVPRDEKSLRSLLGLAGYFTKFIPNLATVLEPMRRVLRQKSFLWTAEAMESFNLLKEMLCEAQVLSSFDQNLQTIVTCDASDYGLGATLTQMKNGKEVTVEFTSRTLSESERKYSIVEKEALACVWACERWNTYLWGRKFTLRTDHKALVTLFSKTSERQSLRLARWSCRLLKYNFEVEYQPGEVNILADALSRVPVTASAAEYDKEDEVICNVALSAQIRLITLDHLKQEVLKDKVMQILILYITEGWPRYNEIELVKPYARFRDELCVCDGIVMRNDKIVVPESLTSSLLHIAHESHQGITRTKQLLRQLYWWPLLDRQVEDLVKGCVICQSNDKSIKTAKAPLQPVEFPSRPWEKLALDIAGPFLRATPECRYAITLVDYYSKWPEVCFTASIITSAVIRFLKTIFSREGFPEVIVTDNGTQFVSHEFEEFLSSRGIKHHKCSLYHPQSNGGVERFNGVLKSWVQTCINTGKPWKMTITEYLAAYRATPHATTGCSPSLLLHGHEMRTKLNVVGFNQGKVLCEPSTLRDKVKGTQDYYKNFCDKKVHTKVVRFNVGDYVRIKKPHPGLKGDSKFSDPIQIRQKLSDKVYITSDGRKWHVDKLIPSTANLQTLESSEQDSFLSFGELEETGEGVESESSGSGSPYPVRRSTRVRRLPQWLATDYELG